MSAGRPWVIVESDTLIMLGSFATDLEARIELRKINGFRLSPSGPGTPAILMPRDRYDRVASVTQVRN